MSYIWVTIILIYYGNLCFNSSVQQQALFAHYIQGKMYHKNYNLWTKNRIHKLYVIIKSNKEDCQDRYEFNGSVRLTTGKLTVFCLHYTV